MLGMCVCGLALVNANAKRMRLIIFSSAACPAVPYFSKLFYKRHEFRKITAEHKICLLIFSTSCVRNVSYSKKN